MMRCWVLFAGIFLLSGCAAAPFEAPPWTPIMEPMPASVLAESARTFESGTYLVTHSALFKFRGTEIPMLGLMELNAAAGRARLVSLNPMGLKIFDIEVLPDSVKTHYVLPELAAYPGLAQAVATSLRRMFINPRPQESDRLTVVRDRYKLQRTEKERDLFFGLGGVPARLYEIKADGPKEKWRLNYYEYDVKALSPFPRGILLTDKTAGYRLMLTLQRIQLKDECTAKSH
jgi:hypothetical protein